MDPHSVVYVVMKDAEQIVGNGQPEVHVQGAAVSDLILSTGVDNDDVDQNMLDEGYNCNDPCDQIEVSGALEATKALSELEQLATGFRPDTVPFPPKSNGVDLISASATGNGCILESGPEDSKTKGPKVSEPNDVKEVITIVQEDFVMDDESVESIVKDSKGNDDDRKDAEGDGEVDKVEEIVMEVDILGNEDDAKEKEETSAKHGHLDDTCDLEVNEKEENKTVDVVDATRSSKRKRQGEHLDNDRPTKNSEALNVHSRPKRSSHRLSVFEMLSGGDIPETEGSDSEVKHTTGKKSKGKATPGKIIPPVELFADVEPSKSDKGKTRRKSERVTTAKKDKFELEMVDFDSKIYNDSADFGSSDEGPSSSGLASKESGSTKVLSDNASKESTDKAGKEMKVPSQEESMPILEKNVPAKVATPWYMAESDKSSDPSSSKSKIEELQAANSELKARIRELENKGSTKKFNIDFHSRKFSRTRDPVVDKKLPLDAKFTPDSKIVSKNSIPSSVEKGPASSMSEKDLLRKESTLDRREQKLRALDSELDERVAAVKVSEGKLWRAERRLKELEKTLEYRERVLRRQETSLQKREKELIDNADVETSAGGGEAETSFTKLYKESTKSRDSEERNSLNEQKKEQLRLKELRLSKLEKELKKKEEDLKKRESACLSTSDAVETAMDVGNENQIAEKQDSDGIQDSEIEQDSGKQTDSIQEKPDSEEKQDSEETQDNEKKTDSEEKQDLEEKQDSEDKVERENPSNIPEADPVQPGTNNDSSVAKKLIVSHVSKKQSIFKRVKEGKSALGSIKKKPITLGNRKLGDKVQKKEYTLRRRC